MLSSTSVFGDRFDRVLAVFLLPLELEQGPGLRFLRASNSSLVVLDREVDPLRAISSIRSRAISLSFSLSASA